MKADLTILVMSSISVSDLFHLSHYSIGLACSGANYRFCAAEKEEERVCTARNVVLISGGFFVGFYGSQVIYMYVTIFICALQSLSQTQSLFNINKKPI